MKTILVLAMALGFSLQTAHAARKKPIVIDHCECVNENEKVIGTVKFYTEYKEDFIRNALEQCQLAFGPDANVGRCRTI